MTSIPKTNISFNFYHLPTSTVLDRKANTTIWIFKSRTLLKKRLWYRCFPVNFAKFLRTPFLQNTSGRLLLYFAQEAAKLILIVENTLNLLFENDRLVQSLSIIYMTVLNTNKPNLHFFSTGINESLSRTVETRLKVSTY